MLAIGSHWRTGHTLQSPGLTDAAFSRQETQQPPSESDSLLAADVTGIMCCKLKRGEVGRGREAEGIALVHADTSENQSGQLQVG